MLEKGKQGGKEGKKSANLASYAALTTPENHRVYRFLSEDQHGIQMQTSTRSQKENKMTGAILPTARNNSEAGRVRDEAEEPGAEKGLLAQATVMGQKVVGFGVETGKWVWLKIREAGSRVMNA